MTQVAYKILTREEAEALEQGRYEGSPLDQTDGFIHLSTAHQVQGTLERHFADRTDLVLAAIDLAQLGNAIRWEKSRGGALFPHLYGALQPEAVIAVAPVDYDEQGRVKLPDERGEG